MPAPSTLILGAIVAALVFATLLYFLRKKYRQQLARAFPQPAERPVVRNGGTVIAYHPEAREIGEAILRAGGNAFDAFVATTAAENVLAEGASSLAGPLAVLVYRAQDGLVEYLDADFNDPLDPAARVTLSDPKPGRAVLVPGAPAGLEALARKYGKLPFSELLQPAIALAEDGFPVNRLMALTIAEHAKLLKKSKYGRSTFFRRGKALKVGKTIRQPEVAEFLRRLGNEGAAYVYKGDWGERFLSAVEANGGRLTPEDLRQYRVKWCRPWTATYRDHTIHSSSGHSYGGLWVLLALKTLEQMTPPAQRPYYWEDADALELMIRISHQVWSEPNIFEPGFLNDPEAVRALLTEEYAASIGERVRSKAPLNFMGAAGSHSYHIIVTDDEGNIASGTTTIEADPWAAGIFVEGIPLTSAGWIPWGTEPGERRLSLFSIHLALEDNRPRFAVGTISGSVVEASFQFLVKFIDYHMSVQDAVSTPRFGTFPGRGGGKKISLNLDRNWLDPRVDGEVVKALKARGIKFQQTGLIDTGLGVVMRLGPEKNVEGVPAPVPYLSNPFKFSA
jgi:gamma-glutamyltranspeptidase / glutathione hydrolase